MTSDDFVSERSRGLGGAVALARVVLHILERALETLLRRVERRAIGADDLVAEGGEAPEPPREVSTGATLSMRS